MASAAPRPCTVFEATVGKFQPILAQLPGRIASGILTGRGRDAAGRAALAGEVDAAAASPPGPALDLDATAADADADLDEAPRPAASLSLTDLGRVLGRADFLPPGLNVHALQAGEYRYQAPGIGFSPAGDDPARLLRRARRKPRTLVAGQPRLFRPGRGGGSRRTTGRGTR